MATTKRTIKKRARPQSRKAAHAARTPAKRSPARRRRSTGTDAIALLKQDHRTVEQLFKRFEKAGDGARRTKRQLVDRMIEELSRHAGIEELVFYPAVRTEVEGATSDVLEALEEHHVVKRLLSDLEDLEPTDERFDAKVTVMMENVRHHVKEEEHDLFPEVRAQLARGRLLEIGAELRAARSRVPTRPHPGAPDEPPGNAFVGGAVAALDRARTVGKRTVERVRDDASVR
jgi:hemerythrin-like domain-containing protein